TVLYRIRHSPISLLFLYNATPRTETYTLSLHDALPILVGEIDVDEYRRGAKTMHDARGGEKRERRHDDLVARADPENHQRDQQRSEEHTSELQSLRHLVCRLLLEKKKTKKKKK